MIDKEDGLGADAELDDDARLPDADAPAGTEAEADDEADSLAAEAMELGWKPIEDWRGDKTGWVDAGEFLDRLKPARLRETIDRQSRELKEQREQLAREKAAFDARLARLDKMGQNALKRQRQQIFADIDARQRAAADAGDVAAFDELKEYEGQVREDFAKEDQEFVAESKQAVPAQAAPDPTVKAWTDANPAIVYNPAKWQAAVAFFTEADARNPNGSTAEHLAHVEGRIEEAWPGTVKPRAKANGQDDQPPRQRGPQIEGGVRQASRGARPKGWGDIPAEEQKILKRHVGEGLYKDEADAAKQYWR
jgi:hypothetical protein